MSKTIQFTISDTEYKVLSMIAKGKGFDTIGKWAKEQIFAQSNRQNPKGIMQKLSQMEELQTCPSTCPIFEE